MKKPERILTQFHSASRPVQRSWFLPRVGIYLFLWLVAALALQIFLSPESPAESSYSPLVQHLLWLLYAPLMIVVGLAQAATWPERFPAWAPWLVVTLFFLHAIVTLTRVRRSSFALLTGVLALLLGVAVFFFIRQSHIPTGG